jgi:FkbM family methyltransferase
LPIEEQGDAVEDGFAKAEGRFLTLLTQAGYSPKVVYDIGAAVGGWSETIWKNCPDALYHMFEPLAEALPLYRDGLAVRLAQFPNFAVHGVALSDTNGTTSMSVSDDAWSSSLIDMSNVPSFGKTVSITQYRLDDYIKAHGLPWPDLIKIDTQATEHRVIAGGTQALEHAEILMVETWLYRGYGPTTPLLTELIAMLEPQGYRLCELGHHFYDEIHRLYGVDAVFAKQGFLERIAPKMPNSRW